MPRLSPLQIALACAVATHLPASIAGPEGNIWRCGNSYSDAPCVGGTQLGAQPQPSAEDRRQRDAGTRRDQAAADRMQRERLEFEAKPRQAVVIGPPPGTEPSASLHRPDKIKKKSARPKKPDGFVASYADPAAQPAKKKKKK